MMQDVLGMFAAGGFAEVVAHRRRTDNRNNQRPRRSALHCALHYQQPQHGVLHVASCPPAAASALSAVRGCGSCAATAVPKAFFALASSFTCILCAAVRAR